MKITYVGINNFKSYSITFYLKAENRAYLGGGLKKYKDAFPPYLWDQNCTKLFPGQCLKDRPRLPLLPIAEPKTSSAR